MKKEEHALSTRRHRKQTDSAPRLPKRWAILWGALALSVLRAGGGLAETVTFVDVTEASGIRFHHSTGTRSSSLIEDMGSGAGFADIDGDGYVDLYIVNIPGPVTQAAAHPNAKTNTLYKNNGDGTFTDITHTAGVGHTGYGMGCVFADIDGDSHLDLYVTNAGPNILYRNNGDTTFTDITQAAGVGCPLWSTGAAFADIDGDSDLDLYVCNYLTYDLEHLARQKEESLHAGKPVPSALNPHVFEPQDNVFYRNNGDGTFTDITHTSGIAAEGGRSMQALFSDFDNDTDLDLYVANDTSANHVYRNNGDGTFTDISSDTWAADFRGSMGLTAGDYDNDGDIDLFISHWIDEENALYTNLHQETTHPKPLRFVDDSYTTGLAAESIKLIGWGTAFFDYDNDGFLDIFVTNGSTFQKLTHPQHLIPQHDGLFKGVPSAGGSPITFTETSQTTGIRALPARVGRGAAFADYDNDGDIDIFIVNNNAQPTLLRNDGGNTNNWLHVTLVGTGTNTHAIGAKLTLKTENKTYLREIYAGDSYMSFNSLTAEFGIGTATQIKSLTIKWPNRTDTQTLENVPINQRLRITQD